MFWTDFTPSPSDPPSPTLTAVDLPDTYTGIAGSRTPTTTESYGMISKVHPADLETGISHMDTNAVRNDTIKEGKQHLERLEPSMHAALQEVKVSIVEVHEGNVYISSNVDDPDNPRNWPKWKRTGAVYMNEEFGLSEEVGTLGLSLYILGFAFGPMVAAPLSETYGRRIIYLITWFFFTLAQIPVALAPNYACVLVFRFLGGLCGSVPLANTGGVINDLFGVEESGYATAMFAFASVAGPPLGNVISGFLAEAAGWRWLFWFYLIVLAVHYVIIIFGIPETRQGIILYRKAQKLRQQGDALKNVFADHEREKSKPKDLFKVSLTRPYVFLFKEPITYLAAAINSFALGMIFLSNTSFPLIFGPGNEGHHWRSSGAINATLGSYVVGAMM
ncbi:hypothetical protein QFC21_002064 [Naganishia friedmannii]|uniref:Uncharacterized protein n=1 Tax=Naganishia friedmannii TaxID=89922 RepID=A0ACC2W0I8_9TREE|nr:hypothetical protein QFC21_002064 [Naganishia friedmannii]